jgi:hypothetical protein
MLLRHIKINDIILMYLNNISNDLYDINFQIFLKFIYILNSMLYFKMSSIFLFITLKNYNHNSYSYIIANKFKILFIKRI